MTSRPKPPGVYVGWVALVVGLALLAAACNGMGAGGDEDFEVWVTDQSGTAGTLYIYNGKDLTDSAGEAVPEVIDLAGVVGPLCVAPAPTRAHMVMFNTNHTHAILSYVATGHVVFIDAATRTPLACIDVGEQAHQAFPAPDGSYVVVADQNGKKLHRINTDYSTNTFTLDSAATLDLAACTTSNGAPCQDATLRPDNAPICSVIDSTSRLAFVTLRGGGMFVLDGTTTPMSIIAEYDKASVRAVGFGCGGIETSGRMFINSGGGSKSQPTGSALYGFPLSDFPPSGFNSPNTPAPTVVFSKDEGDHDSHMMLSTAGHGREGGFLWVGDRFANEIEVVEAETESLVNTFSLAGAVSSDPAPDIMDISPNGDYAFVVLRGPCPLTGNVEDVNNAVGATPGVGVVQVTEGGSKGELVGIAAITNPAPAGFDCPSRSDDAAGSITNQADPHGLRVRLKGD